MTHLRITEGSEYIIHIFLQNIPYSLCFPLENVTPLRITLMELNESPISIKKRSITDCKYH
jgi:hypothetical protein